MIDVETLAHVHWWVRTSTDDMQAAVGLGAAYPAAQQAAENVSAMWLEVRDVEVEAMRQALRTVTLADMLSVTKREFEEWRNG